MEIQNILLEYVEDCVFSSSGILINDQYVLTTYHIFLPILERILCSPDLEHLQKNELLNPNLLFKYVENYEFNVVSSDPLERNNTTKYRSGKLKAFFVSDELQKSYYYLKNWSCDTPDIHFEKRLLSIFFVLEIQSNFREETFQKCVDYLLNLISTNVNVGNDLYVKSSPFGNRNLINTLSKGIISNAIGYNSCLILSDCPVVPGSEGGLVMQRTGEHFIPFGMVLSCLNFWNGEWLGLTLIVPFYSLFGGLSRIHFNKKPLILRNGVYDTVEKSLVQIVSGISWGTGILVNKKLGIFLTNSHVVGHEDVVSIYWKGTKILGKNIYSNNDEYSIDLAVIECFPNEKSKFDALDLIEIHPFLQTLNIGDILYAAGYPIFASDLKPKPTITRGHLSKIHETMLITTCSVLPGASGGALLDQNGFIVGVLVSNIKSKETGAVYPRLNMCISINAFWNTLELFMTSSDYAVLQDLSKIGHKLWAKL